MYPPNYTKNRKVRDLLDTPDPKDKNAYNSDAEPEAMNGKSSVNKYREIRMVQYRVRHQDLRIWEHYEGKRSI